MRIVCVPSLRPGAVVNGQRVKRIDLTDDQMSVQMGSNRQQRPRGAKNRNSAARLKKEFPELAAGLHLPKIGRVEAISDTTGHSDISAPFRPRFAVNV
ncbi:Uncharacterised protein [Citrobacter koseri]|uniref:Uncharacterized protein n=1 Tax=Citrobacter koseri TaxID=545 RepID=A0A447UNS5_CITKO|nr:Uncharacterised protein [Citrobacter koseri]